MENIAKAYAAEKGLQFSHRLGLGAFKETFLVSNSSGQLALKVIGTKASQTRTEREIEAIVRCNHTGIAKLVAVERFSLNGTTYTCLLEEYLAGGTLHDRISSGPLTRSAVVKIGEALIDALEHIADLGLVHRDLKPENIMFRSTDSFNPVVVDFGLVRDLSRSSLTNTWAPIGPGTPLYAPAEQLNNRKELIDWRSDQFSLGVTLGVALGIHHPYWNERDLDYECVERVANYERPQDPFAVAAKARDLVCLVKMVQPYPVDRFRTIEQLRRSWPQN